jgi:hypothetical protein
MPPIPVVDCLKKWRRLTAKGSRDGKLISWEIVFQDTGKARGVLQEIRGWKGVGRMMAASESIDKMIPCSSF